MKPQRVLSDVSMISSRAGTTAALKKDGSLWMWGMIFQGSEGGGYSTSSKNVPLKVLDGVKVVSQGSNFTLACKQDGSLWAWGILETNTPDGVFTVTNSTQPVQIMDGIKVVSAGYDHALALKGDGSVWALGRNYGLNNELFNVAPIRVLDNVIDIASGDYYSVALKDDKSLWVWGSIQWVISDGGHYIESNTLCTTPQKILENVKSVAAGDHHCLVLMENGSLWAFGYNKDGQLGDGTQQNSVEPIKIMDNVRSMAAGGNHSLAVTEEGSIWAWGHNGNSLLGDGTTTNRLIPIKLFDGSKASTSTPLQSNSDLSSTALEENSIHVNNAMDLISAIKSNTSIILDPGDYNLNDEHLMMRLAAGDIPPGISYVPASDTGGTGIVFSGLKNTKISSSSIDRTIYTTEKGSYVLSFKDCSNIMLSNLTLGHKIDSDLLCEAGVVSMDGCSGMDFQNCDLYGCGTEGLTITNSRNVNVNKSIIRDCLYRAMTISTSTNIHFNECVIGSNGNDGGQSSIVSVYSACKDIEYINCVFSGNGYQKHSAQDPESYLFYLTNDSKNEVIITNLSRG